MFNTKCGCPYCKGVKIPTTKWGWKGLRNKRGNMYGSYKNPTAKHGGRKQAH